jgi:hypothetical protein
VLRELQRRILEGLWSGDGAAAAQEMLSRGRALTPAEQLAVYRGSVSSTLTAALEEVYPVCRRLVGDRFFGAAAAAFVRRTRSRSPDLSDYGEGFAAFLTGLTPAAPLPYLPDVARLEWAWHRALHGPGCPLIDMDALASAVAEAEPERVVFRLPRSAALIDSSFPIHLIWQANQPDHHGEDVVFLSQGGASLLVLRRELTRFIETLEPPERCLLHAVAEGLTLGDVCLRVASEHPSADAGRLLAVAIRRGWLSGFEMSRHPPRSGGC